MKALFIAGATRSYDSIVSGMKVLYIAGATHSYDPIPSGMKALFIAGATRSYDADFLLKLLDIVGVYITLQTISRFVVEELIHLL
jgi:hypothetical protein